MTVRAPLAVALALPLAGRAAAYAHEKPPAEAPKQAEPVKQLPAGTAAKIAVAAAGRDITVETALYRAVVNTAGGVITRWELKDYREADKTEVGVMPFFRKLFSSEKKAEAPKKPLGNVELFTRYEGVKAEEIIPLYSQASIFVCPSVYEPFGIIHLEAESRWLEEVMTDIQGTAGAVGSGG